MTNATSNNNLHNILNNEDFSGFIYPPDLFQNRLKEEMLRSNRTHRPFLYIKIPTHHYDALGLKTKSGHDTSAWEIAVLTLLSQSNFLDIKGYLKDDQGLGIIFLDCQTDFIQIIKKAVVESIKKTHLDESIHLKPSSPYFKVYAYMGDTSKTSAEIDEYFNKHHIDEGLFSIRSLRYSDLKHNDINHSLINFTKRAFDITLSLLAITFLSPLLILIGLIVKLTDPAGKVIFKQIRVGQNGKHFTMYKFRSMYTNAEKRLKDLQKDNEADGPVFKIKNDPRIFPFGRFIRKYSLDELPQLFNILNGAMAIVGPRPPIVAEVKEYLPWHKMRLGVKPGLTCHWQVSGRSNIGFDEWMRLDNKYVRHGNFKTDMELIGKTFKVVIKGDGAY